MQQSHGRFAIAKLLVAFIFAVGNRRLEMTSVDKDRCVTEHSSKDYIESPYVTSY